MTNVLPLQSIFWPRENHWLKQGLLVIAGVMVLAIASQLSIPLVPVPLTFQSATVILIGMAYGPRYGTSVIATYWLAGICGLPVFADFSAGPAVFIGPTGGYLLGFLPAAFLSGYLAQTGWARYRISSFIAAILSASIIFLLGVTVLSRFVGWHQAILLGVMPFIISEPIKLLAAALIVPRFWKKS